MKRIGIMGGTFNPIHLGHLMLAEASADYADLDQVWMIPSGHPYMKQGQELLPPEDRYHMTCLATQGNPRMHCIDIEVKREGNTYSYETLELLQEQFPEYEFTFIMGADCLFSIEKWKYPERIFACCRVLAAVREGADVRAMEQKCEELTKRFQADIKLFSFRNLEISSTNIRQMVAADKSIRYLVPDAVCEYILEKGFYRNEVNRTEEDTEGNGKRSGCQAL